ncbi:hypothetical protein [Variovorax sp. YR566]|uniref:hypothetical protein n=1 Tax=Variovorax sp. YR566 TaxID=3450237 RepID=UPI003F7ECC91
MHARLVVVLSGGWSCLDPRQIHRHWERVQQLKSILLWRTQIRALGKEVKDRLVDAVDQPLIDRDPDGERRNAFGSRLHVVQGVRIEDDIFHPTAEKEVRDLGKPGFPDLPAQRRGAMNSVVASLSA